MKIEINKENIKKGAATVLLLSTLFTTGCQSVKNDQESNKLRKAIILNGNVATIVDIKYSQGFRRIDGAILKLSDGTDIFVSYDNLILIDKIDDNAYAEELAQQLVGENGEVNYYNSENVQRKLK